MNYTDFQNEILKKIIKILNENYEVELHKIMKNNDIELVAITIREKQSLGAVPTIYLEDFYEMYCAGMCVEDITNNIIAIYERQKGKVRISIDDFKDFEKIKGKIMLKLVNYERNQTGLETMPHKKILDLAIVFYVLWDDGGEQRMTSTIKNSHMELWGVGIKEVYDVAYENTISKLSVNIRNMRDIVYDIYKDMKKTSKMTSTIENELLEEIERYEYPMYVISNQKKILGASVILYEQVLKYFYEKFQCKYYVIPSSIHEVIILPKTDMSVEEMKKMVTEINENEVDYLEVLSDNVYRYDGEKLVIAGMI